MSEKREKQVESIVLGIWVPASFCPLRQALLLWFLGSVIEGNR